MIKSFLFGFNILFLILLGSFQKSEPKVSQDIPASLNPGEETVVTVNIDKSDVTGFAKLQINLAPGLKAEPVENAGASFTFNDHKVKFIWMALPETKSFTLKYRLIAEENAAGLLDVDGRFSYIYQNERKNFDIPAKSVRVGTSDAIAAERIKNSIADKAANKEATAEVKRIVTSIGINQWRVDIALHKSNLQGFAKIEEHLPDGYTVINIKASSAVFSVDDRTVKYIWYDIPENEDIVVTYKMLPVIAMDGFTPEISGEFSYLKNEETVSLPIRGGVQESAETPDEVLAEITPEKSAETTVDSIAKNDELAENTENPVETTPPAKKPEATPEPKSEAAPAKSPTKTDTGKIDSAPETATAENRKSLTDANIIDVPEPQTGIFYRVQIAAGKNNLKQPVFAKIYRFDEKFNIENHNGLFKYTTGHFQVYKAARDGRERITARYDKFQGPFVTAYNSGERITVQEALMITNQKWYQ